MVGMPNLHNPVAVWMIQLFKHFFYDTWKTGGLGAPPARHFIKIGRIWFDTVWLDIAEDPSRSVQKLFQIVSKLKKFFQKKNRKIK